jgi:hypothetical protein
MIVRFLKGAIEDELALPEYPVSMVFEILYRRSFQTQNDCGYF